MIRYKRRMNRVWDFIKEPDSSSGQDGFCIDLSCECKLTFLPLIYTFIVGVHSHGGWSSTIGDKA